MTLEGGFVENFTQWVQQVDHSHAVSRRVATRFRNGAAMALTPLRRVEPHSLKKLKIRHNQQTSLPVHIMTLHSSIGKEPRGVARSRAVAWHAPRRFSNAVAAFRPFEEDVEIRRRIRDKTSTAHTFCSILYFLEMLQPRSLGNAFRRRRLTLTVFAIIPPCKLSADAPSFTIVIRAHGVT